MRYRSPDWDTSNGRLCARCRRWPGFIRVRHAQPVERGFSPAPGEARPSAALAACSGRGLLTATDFVKLSIASSWTPFPPSGLHDG